MRGWWEGGLSINIKLFNHVIIGKLNTEVLNKLLFMSLLILSSCTAVQFHLEGSKQVTE